MKTRKIFELGLAAVMIAPAFAFAQTLYKQVRPDGSIIYSDKPVPGAEILDTRDIPPPPPPPSREQQARPPSLPGVGSATEGKPAPRSASKPESKRSAADTANDEVVAAQKALDDAKRRRDEGQEPQPGDRLGTAKGGSRLSEAYEERLRALDQAVTDAEARLQRAYDARNAAR